jgi:hypothetical protein
MKRGWIRSAQVLCVILCGAQLALPAVATSASGCVPIIRGAPCIGPIQSGYSFGGLGGGATSLIKAKAGPEHLLVQKVEHNKLTEIKERTFTWHSVPSVKIVAVFIVSGHPGSTHFTYRQLKSSEHHGKARLVESRERKGANLLLEGERL